MAPGSRPDPPDLKNAPPLQPGTLRQDTPFGAIDPPIFTPNVPAGAVRAQSILFAGLSITLLVAFVAVLGKQWILYHARPTNHGNIHWGQGVICPPGTC